MSNELEIETVNNFNYDHLKNIYINNFNSASMQTSKGPDFFRNENLINNILSKNESNDLNNIIQIDDKIKQKNDKFAHNYKNKYIKFLNFIKERHFKRFSTNKKNFRTFTPINYTTTNQINKTKKDSISIFLTQDLNNKKKKEEDKLLFLYKKIFDKGLDEANYFSSIKLVPLVENNVHDWKNSLDYDDQNEIEILTGSNFHSKYAHPNDEQTFRLMKKRGFLNFQTNPAVKKGLNYNKTRSHNNIPKITPIKEQNEKLFYNTSLFRNLENNEKATTSQLNPDNLTLVVKLRNQSSKGLIIDNKNPFKKDKFIKTDMKTRKVKIADSNLMTVNENQIINAKISKKTSSNTSGLKSNKDNELIIIDDLFNPNQIGKSKSKYFKQFTKVELTSIIKSKQKKFNTLKKKMFNNNYNKDTEQFEKIKNNKFIPSKKFGKNESLSTPFLSADTTRKNYFNKPNKERITGIYDDNINERKMTKVLYNIFDKYEVDYVLKQNKYKLNL